MGRVSRERDFDAFVSARSAALLRTATLTTGDGGVAEELLTGALARTYRAWRRIDGPESVEGYVRRELLTAVWSHRRPDRVGRLAGPHAEPTTAAPGPPACSSGEVGGNAGNGREPTSAENDRERVWEAQRRLPERQRAALGLAAVEGLSDEEISRVVGAAPAVVRLAVSEGVAGLARQLPAPVSTQELVALVRATWAVRSRDVRPSPELADKARDGALRLARRDRAHARVGVAVACAGLVGFALVSRGEPSSDPLPPRAETAPQALAPDADSMTPGVIALADRTGTLLAASGSIVDGSRRVSLAGVPGARLGVRWLSAAAGGYVLVAPTHYEGAAGPFLDVLFVRSSGTARLLGQTSAAGRVTVSPDGRLVAFVDVNPGQTPTALVVRRATGREVGRLLQPPGTRPLAVTSDGVWFTSSEGSAGQPSYWDLSTGRVTAWHMSPPAVVVGTLAGRGCAVFPGPGWFPPTMGWCEDSAALSPDRRWVAAAAPTIPVDGSADGGGIVVLDARSGEVLGLIATPLVQVEALTWGRGGRTLLVSGAAEDRRTFLVGVDLSVDELSGHVTGSAGTLVEARAQLG